MLRLHEVMHLKPQSMQDITPLLQKKVHYYPLISHDPLCPKVLIVLSQTEALNVVFKYIKFEQAPCTSGLTFCDSSVHK